MRLRPNRWTALVAVCAAAAVTAAVAAVLTHDQNPPPAGVGSVRAVTIPAAGGARLAAEVYTPPGPGPFPLVVLPASWGEGATEYATVGTGFAALGYVAVAYAQRGFGQSSGAIDLAGPATRGDVGTVIDWAARHADAQSRRVAVVGVSYGAGVALLAAEHDPRIVAVAALSGWADLGRVLAPGGALNLVDAESLFTGPIAGRPLGGQFRRLVSELDAKQADAARATVRAMSRARSPIDGVAALNRNRTAVFLSSTYQDSILPPGDLIGLFTALTGPKRLQLAPGDHGANALAGLTTGRPTRLWTAVARWVARYLGQPAPSAPQSAPDDAAPDSAPVQLQDARTGQWHDYPSWADASRARRFALSAPAGPTHTGGIGPAGASGAWTVPLAAGVASAADAGPQQMTTGRTYEPPTVTLGDVSRTAAAIWSGPTLTAPTRVTGVPRVHLSVAASAGPASVFAYLYDVDAGGTGRLVSFGPAGVPAGGGAIDIDLGPIAWTVPAGHHLALVVDSIDARYLGRSQPGSSITLASSAADPATLTLGTG